MHFDVFFSSLARRADVAIADRHGELSGFELAHEVTRRAAELSRQGVGVTTPVLIRVSNDINSVISLLAVWSLDALAFVGNPFTPVEEVTRTVHRFGISHVLGDAPSMKAIHAMSGGPLRCLMHPWETVKRLGFAFLLKLIDFSPLPGPWDTPMSPSSVLERRASPKRSSTRSTASHKTLAPMHDQSACMRAM